MMSFEPSSKMVLGSKESWLHDFIIKKRPDIFSPDASVS